MSALFDESVYDELREALGDEDVAEALREFFDDTAAKMARLEARGDERPLLKLEAHSIKSSAGTFGFADLSQLARELEAGSATLPPEALRDYVTRMRSAFSATQEFARQRLGAAA